jgi:hypothetical protein
VLVLFAGLCAAAAGWLSSGEVRLVSAWPLALGAVGAWAAWRAWPNDDPARWLRGSAGERETAAILDRLPRRRWTVLHDRAIPGSRANVDHLVIGPTGVWVVDSKAYRAPLRVRRGRVWAGSVPVPTSPVRWEATRVGELLAVDATPIVAVHGHGLRRRGKWSDGVRVIPAPRLPRRLRRARRTLGTDDVATLVRRAAAVFRCYGESR